jgi:hypothetical protein
METVLHTQPTCCVIRSQEPSVSVMQFCLVFSLTVTSDAEV